MGRYEIMAELGGDMGCLCCGGVLVAISVNPAPVVLATLGCDVGGVG